MIDIQFSKEYAEQCGCETCLNMIKTMETLQENMNNPVSVGHKKVLGVGEAAKLLQEERKENENTIDPNGDTTND